MATQATDYDPAQIEAHWQAYWANQATFRAPDGDPREPFYILAMYPYPSGSGLHIGHSEQYTAPDIVARFERARGKNVLQPMGWDAFGLPTEQTAVETGVHPREVTRRNVARFKQQLQRHGFALDWEREINTTDPHYVRWTQWIFLQMFKHGLAYVDARPVWFCPALGTVLANEEVIDGKSERGSHPVVRRALRQWVLRITAYAEKLLQGLDELDWPESTKTLQRNWIGRSEGAEVHFPIEGHDGSLTVYTTRPDTLFGATYMVLAPEHPLVETITTAENRDAVRAYVEAAAKKSDLDRTELAKEKTGVPTGAFATNPANGERIPIWVADYVLISYGTGAIMAVPAQDERDWEFATVFGLNIIRTVQPPADHPEDQAYTGDGPAINSGFLDGLDVNEAKAKMTAWLEAEGKGSRALNYKLRDWLFSRQRYWGEPFPIVWVSEEDYARRGAEVAQWCPKQAVTATLDGQVRYALPVPPSELPLGLPETDDFQPSPDGQSPLAKQTDWLQIFVSPETGEFTPASNGKCPDGWVRATRETNTMPQWAGSCWYHLRYLDPHNAEKLIAPGVEQYWKRPDIYTGGQEHAVLHLLYARFWHRFLYDIGALQHAEPYPALIHQGMILGEDSQKMSKSRGNVINPDAMISEYGADAVRMYLMFMGPYEDDKPWSTSGAEGLVRFLRRVWRLFLTRDGTPNPQILDCQADAPETLRELHSGIKKVTQDLAHWRFNTAVSQLMILLNHLQKVEMFTADTARTFLQLLAPFAPHLGEELWARYGGESSIVDRGWPVHDEAYLAVDTVTIGLLVNGKPRGEATLPHDAPEAEALAAAHANERVQAHLEGKTIRKVIYKPGKILNLVVG